MSAAPRFELDAGVRRRDGGWLLVGGVPPRLLRLSDAGARALDTILAAAGRDEAVAAAVGPGRPTTAEAALARRLDEAGLLHPLPPADAAEPEVTTVIPVLDGGERLGELVATLAAAGPVIVVDDGSRDGSPARAAAAGARIVANDGRPGPAGARNAGLRAASTELVAFLDADCIVEPGWRRGLASLLAADADLAAVGPRIRGAPGEGALARYERRHSPLDLGPHAGRVGPRHRVAYLPTAALLVRRAALLALGGFDETMRFGEDVDMIWRLRGAGHGVRYVPSREVLHRPRPTPATFAAQRFGYGSSASDLAARHGGAVTPLRVGRHVAAVWATAVARPAATPLALGASLAIVASRGSDGAARKELALLALRGQTDAAGHLARALVREWLPISLALALPSRRARRALALAAAVEAARAIGRPPGSPVDALRAPAIRALDHASYAAGLWRGVIRRRRLAALLPASAGESPPVGLPGPRPVPR